MAKYSDWRTDLREVMDDDVDSKKVTGKGVNNNKLIKINPKLGEAVEEIGGQILEMKEVDDANKDETIEKDDDAEKKARMAEKVKKKEAMLKKRIVRMKMMAVNQGAADSIVAGYEPEGEQLDETPKGDVGKDYETVQRRRNEDQNRRRGDRGSRLPDKAQELRRNEHKMRRGAKTGPLRSGKQPDKVSQDVSRLRRITDKFASQAHRKEEVVYEGDYHSGQGEKIQKRTKKWMEKKGQKGAPGLDAMKARTAEHKAKRGVKEEVVTERLGGKGYKSYTDLRGKKISGDWEDSDRGAGNKAKKRAGGKVEKKSPTYKAHVLNKEEVVVDEGVMKFIKDRVGGKKKPEKKAQMDKTTEKLHDLRKDKFKTDKQKEHEKYVNFLPVDEAVKGQDTEMRKVKAAERKAGTDPKNTEDPTGKNYAKGQRASVSWWKDKTKVQKEEVVTELNRFGKETGKATGSLNKRPGSPVATRNEPNSPVNTVRRMIRKDAGRPEGQQKKTKGVKGLAQPGDRRFTPAQTISRMRAQVAAADAAMRDTRGT